MTDHIARAVELHATLAVADAVSRRPVSDDDASQVGPDLDVAPDAPSPVARDLQRVIGERDRLREGIRAAVARLAPDDPTEPSRLYVELRALLADDPTHRGPITVGGKPVEERGASGSAHDVSVPCKVPGFCDRCVWTDCAHACHRAPKENR